MGVSKQDKSAFWSKHTKHMITTGCKMAKRNQEEDYNELPISNILFLYLFLLPFLHLGQTSQIGKIKSLFMCMQLQCRPLKLTVVKHNTTRGSAIITNQKLKIIKCHSERITKTRFSVMLEVWNTFSFKFNIRVPHFWNVILLFVKLTALVLNLRALVCMPDLYMSRCVCVCVCVCVCACVHKQTAGHTAGDSCIVRGPHVARVCSHHRHLPPCISRRLPGSGPVPHSTTTLAWRLSVHTLLHACHLYHWWAICCFFYGQHF